VESRLDGARDEPPVEHGKAFTGDATPVEPGRVEVELAYAPSWWATAGAVDRLSGEQHQVAASVTVGLLPDVDARIVVGPARRTKVVTLQMRVSCGTLEKPVTTKKASEAVENRTTMQRQVNSFSFYF